MIWYNSLSECLVSSWNTISLYSISTLRPSYLFRKCSLCMRTWEMGRTIYLEEYLYTVQLGVTCTKTDLLGHRLETGGRPEPFLSLSYAWLCQNGYDCSPIAVAVMMVLFTKGPEYAPHPQVKKPHLECAHSSWSRMLLDLTEGIQECYALWNHLSSSNHLFEFQPTDEIIKIVGALRDYEHWEATGSTGHPVFSLLIPTRAPLFWWWGGGWLYAPRNVSAYNCTQEHTEQTQRNERSSL